VNKHEETLATYSPDQPKGQLELIKPRCQPLYPWWGAPSGAPHCNQLVALPSRRSPQHERHRSQPPELGNARRLRRAGRVHPDQVTT
jgi:hypothetical protein